MPRKKHFASNIKTGLLIAIREIIVFGVKIMENT
jgi:hypothetical protein